MQGKSGRSRAATCPPSSGPRPVFHLRPVELLPCESAACQTSILLLITEHEFHCVACPPISLRSRMRFLQDTRSSYFYEKYTCVRFSVDAHKPPLALRPA